LARRRSLAELAALRNPGQVRRHTLAELAYLHKPAEKASKWGWMPFEQEVVPG